MNKEVKEAFAEIKLLHGNDSLERVEQMMKMNAKGRLPFQEEAKWVLPGLSKDPWFERDTFPQLQTIVEQAEKISPSIKAEINQAINGESGQIGAYQHYLKKHPDWHALYLFKDGEKVVASKEVVPETWNFMENSLGEWLCPLLEMHFSILNPGVTIPPHCDLWNFSINLHVAIEVPEGDCAIQVATETRKWKEGKCLIFDYSFLHKAWNNTSEKRICLLADIWHPEVTMAERKALTVFISELRRLIA